MGFVKADLAKKYRQELSVSKAAPKTFEEILLSISESTKLSIDGKRKEGGKITDSKRKVNVLRWVEGAKAWMLFITYANELAYGFDIKVDKSNADGAKKLAIEYLNNLAAGKIDSNEKAEIHRVIGNAKARGIALSNKNKNKATTSKK
ncbi:hypothetical protein EB001_26870 [bacterium]|jgi:hypothetical protein|nr:hypothetical protein [bacterium]